MSGIAIIRNKFLDYFQSQKHKIVPSSPLIPQNDPTLMFVNSGMVQFKNVFTGEENLGFTRAATCQKSVRAGGKHNDLDNVGYTARHHTFFEMIGNFSFGDYFKEEAIQLAWSFLTKELEIDKNKLYVTHYHTDDEAKKLWQSIANLSSDRIISINTNDNFWSMGETGPCGPCSEIFYDHGAHIRGGLPGTPEQDGDRYVEIWNLVFMQLEQLAGGKQIPLPKPSIDTGCGLERLAAVMQGVHDNYEIDLFRNLIDVTSQILRVKVSSDNHASFKVIADHLRSISFLIADGILPSNEGRGYVLRRIMRRAMRHAHILGSKEPIIYKLLPSLIQEMGKAYPELIRAEKLIEQTIYAEENKFKITLDKGLRLLDDEIPNLSDKTLSGTTAFKLYDTYGFPLDLTIDILKGKNMLVDEEGFNKEMQAQKQRAKAAWAGSGETATDEIWFDLHQKHGATEFLGYELNEAEAIVTDVVALKDDLSYLLTNQTPFYAESGGQMGDRGVAIDINNQRFEIIDTKKFLGKLHLHIIKNSNLKSGDKIKLIIDKDYRNKLRSNHSATHLLHYVLRKKLGAHITQKGSLVASDRLRFDYSHMQGLNKAEIREVEDEINDLIMQNSSVNIRFSALQEAIDNGAMALFGEKYDSEVRVVSMGDSIELCGGTHVKALGDIGVIKIISESAIASGIRRIEAVTGNEVIKISRDNEDVLYQIYNTLKTNKAEVYNKVYNLVNDYKRLEQENNILHKRIILSDTNILKQENLHDYNFITVIDSKIDPKILRLVVEDLKYKSDSVIIAASNFDNKSSIVIAVSNNLTDKIDASNLIKIFMETANGKGGGGKKDMAQGGGYDYSLVNKSIDTIKQMI